ncbi:hypothetical protein HN371_16555 [Candidatus Poribacteria bacterium]|nr:hypothetical protein [Candidatus Poribacteria bacterium]MBT5537053.1 hypothetical protein [Candidatus Poribacteria bacterium]MBT7809242.1 hypothetical protein [Candidatus Poribacteria bacterium]
MHTRYRTTLCVLLTMGVLAHAAQARFREIISASGIHIANDSGAIVADFNGDNLPDALFGQSGGNSLGLYMNNGNLTFTNEAATSGLPLGVNGGQGNAGDINGDGDIDLLARFGSDLVYYENTGLANPRFEFRQMVIQKVGIAPALVDYDSDGDLDVFVGGHNISPENLLLHSDLVETGVVTFHEILLGVQGTAHSGITWADADNDRDLDVYISIDNGSGSGTSRFLRNELTETGFASFTDFSLPGALTSFAASHSGDVAFGDYDQDGDLDVYFGVGFFTANRFYHNDLAEALAPGDGYPLDTPAPPLSYREIAGPLGVTRPIDGNQARFIDYDNDGDLDLFAGHSGGGSIFLYRNNLVEAGSATFTDVTAAQGLSGISGEKSPHFFDMDLDGDLDILMPGNARGNRLYVNENPPRNSLRIQLVGVDSARDGNGSRVVLENSGRRQTQEAMAHYQDGWTWTDVHFGLGADAAADRVTVYWPSGIIQERTGVSANQILTLVESADAAPALVSVDDALVDEGDAGDTTITFTITLDTVLNEDVVVVVDTADGTAVAGEDYVALTAMEVTLPAGVTSEAVTVTIVGDTAYEPDETFTLVLSNPMNAVLGNDAATGTIINDDDVPQLAVADAVVEEGDAGVTTMEFALTLSASQNQAATVHVATTDGTATADDDYTSAASEVTFAAGDTVAFHSVDILGDTAFEPDETFTLTLSGPVNVVLQNDTAIGTIVNDDPEPLPLLYIADATSDEGAGTMDFVVVLDRVDDDLITVDVTTVDETANSIDDYTAVSLTLTFEPGTTARTVTVPITDDAVPEPDETFGAQLANPFGAELGSEAGTGTIVNDDEYQIPTLFGLDLDVAPLYHLADEAATAVTEPLLLHATDRAIIESTLRTVLLEGALPGFPDNPPRLTSTPGADIGPGAFGNPLTILRDELAAQAPVGGLSRILSQSRLQVAALIESDVDAVRMTLAGSAGVVEAAVAPLFAGGTVDYTFAFNADQALGSLYLWAGGEGITSPIPAPIDVTAHYAVVLSDDPASLPADVSTLVSTAQPMVESASGRWRASAAASLPTGAQVVYWFSARFFDDATGAGVPLTLADGLQTHEMAFPDPANVQCVNRGILDAAQHVVASMGIREDIVDPLASDLLGRFTSLLVRDMLNTAESANDVGDTGLASVFRTPPAAGDRALWVGAFDESAVDALPDGPYELLVEGDNDGGHTIARSAPVPITLNRDPQTTVNVASVAELLFANADAPVVFATHLPVLVQSDDGSPLSTENDAALITITTRAGGATTEVETGIDGAAVLRLIEGDYDLTATADGYGPLPEPILVTVAPGVDSAATTIVLSPPTALAITAPDDGGLLAWNAQAVAVEVDIQGHGDGWAWQLDAEFPTDGPAGGNPIAGGVTSASVGGLVAGESYVLYVVLTDGAGGVLGGGFRADVSFSLAPTPTLSILTPADGQVFPFRTTEAVLSVAIANHDANWAWRLDDPFPTTGPAGGSASPVDTVTATIPSLVDGSTHTVHVALTDAAGSVLEPNILASSDFSVEATQTELREFIYAFDAGLNYFSPTVNAVSAEASGVTLDVADDGLKASHVLTLGARVITQLDPAPKVMLQIRQKGKNAGTIAGDDFPLLGGTGYSVFLPDAMTLTLIGTALGEATGQYVPASPSGRPFGLWSFAIAAEVSHAWLLPADATLALVNEANGARAEFPVARRSFGATAFVDTDFRAIASHGDRIRYDLVSRGYHMRLGGVREITVDDLSHGYAMLTLDARPQTAALLPNYPNPFNPETWIPFELTTAADVVISIYAIDGSRVRRIDLGSRDAGYHLSRSRAAYWDGRNDDGERTASGAYVVELVAGDTREVRRLAILK